MAIGDNLNDEEMLAFAGDDEEEEDMGQGGNGDEEKDDGILLNSQQWQYNVFTIFY